VVLARGFAELSPEAVYFRFFRVKQRLTERELQDFRIDSPVLAEDGKSVNVRVGVLSSLAERAG
jgi:hypothetical protein